MHFQYSCKLASKLLPPSEDCRLIKKNASLEITETVELKNLLLGMKNIENSVNSVCKNMCHIYKIMFKQIVPVLFQCFLKALEYHFETVCLKVILWLVIFSAEVPWLIFAIQMLHTSSHCVPIIFSATNPAR